MAPRHVVSRRRVVVTGLGLITPVGGDTETAWAGVVSGKSGATELETLEHADFPVHFGCEIKDFDPAPWLDKREAKRVDRFTHFAVAAAGMAIADARIDLEAVKKERCGVVFGSGIGGILSIEGQCRRFLEKGARRISPFTIPMLMCNCGSGMIAIKNGFGGPNYAPVSACASAAHAIGLAMRHIQWGEADLVITGGAEAGISYLGLGGFGNMKALSTRNDDPKKASRPFDLNRDGFVQGEGAGAIVLEELEQARARGAPIRAEILGYGMTDDAYHITAPAESGAGAARAMHTAIADAGIVPEQIDYINAHGTSTPYNDRVETIAIKTALGDEAARRVSISSTKGCTGHMLGASGGVEFGFATLAIQQGLIPPTINYETPDPDCDLDYTPNQSRKREIRYALSNSLGFGGHNCTICLGRYEE